MRSKDLGLGKLITSPKSLLRAKGLA